MKATALASYHRKVVVCQGKSYFKLLLSVGHVMQRLLIVRSAKRCHCYTLGLLMFALSDELDGNLSPGIMGQLWDVNCFKFSGYLASKRQTTSGPKYNGDISLLI